MKVIKDLKYYNELGLDIYLPNSILFTTIIYFHGGGFTEGSKNDCYEMAEEFAEKGYCFVSVDYSLYPNTKFPNFLVEASNAVRFVKNILFELGGNEKLVILGQSAGAYLTLMMALDDAYLKNVGLTTNDIEAFLVESSQPTAHFNIIHYEEGLPHSAVLINKYAPMYYLDKDTSFKHMLLMYYTDDIPHRKEQNEMLYEEFKKYNLDKVVKPLLLEGKHCDASCKKDEMGKYRIVDIVINYLKEIKL